MPTGSEGQRLIEQTTDVIASLFHAVTKDGYLAAAGRQGVKELANVLGQAWPDSNHVHETGTIFSPTQGEIAQARSEEPPREHDVDHGRDI